MSALRPYVPEDFDAFWADVVSEVRAVQLEFDRSLRNEFDAPGLVVERIDFRGTRGKVLHGWLAYPQGARRLPAFLWLAPYGRASALPDKYGTRRGFVSMSFNPFGLDAFHTEEYRPERGYFAQGIEEPRTWLFREMFQDAFLAVKVLQAQIEAHEERCSAMGLSQGGGMALWLGAHCPIVRAVCADMPFLCAVNDTLSRPVYRYPLKEIVDYADSIPLGLPRAQHTLGYFDTVNQATRCTAPVQVSVGLKDPAVRPSRVRAAFEALPGEKRLVEYPGGHDWDPEMIPNNAEWLTRWLA